MFLCATFSVTELVASGGGVSFDISRDWKVGEIMCMLSVRRGEVETDGLYLVMHKPRLNKRPRRVTELCCGPQLKGPDFSTIGGQ